MDTASTPTPPTPTDCVSTTEGCLTQSELNDRKLSLARSYRSWGGQAYTNSYFLDGINADDAYGHLKLMRDIELDQLGAGVDIGIFAVFEDGDGPHPLESHQSLQDAFPGTACVLDACASPRMTALASVAAGRRFDASTGMFGVAPGARLQYSTIRSSDASNLQLLGESTVNSFIGILLDLANVDILMIPSWGLSDHLDDYLDNPLTISTTLRRNYSDTIFVSDASDTSNALTFEADFLNMPLVMASRSNCGSRIADYCITVPYNGSHQYAAGDDTDVDFRNYTSTDLSSGIVAGGLAVMKQLFRDQLSPLELRSRLFATANKSGIYADRSRYGQGLMDLGAATNPWGVATFMDTRSSAPGSGGARVDSSFLSLGAPFGDGLTQSLGQQEVAAFDSLGAPFWFEAASFTVPSGGASLATRLNDFLHPAQLRSIPETWQFNLQEKATATEIGHLALTNGASRLTMAGPQGVSATAFHKPQALEGLSFAWSPAPLPGIAFGAGYLNEQDSLLGSSASGALGQLSGQTLFFTTELDTALPAGWQLAAQGELGMVGPSVASSQFINDFSSLSTSAFRLAASRPFANGSTLRFSLSSPLRVDSGAADLSLPTGRTQDGSVTGRDFSASLVPTGRQLDLTAMVEFPALGGDISLGATRSEQPRHQRDALAEWAFFTGYRAGW